MNEMSDAWTSLTEEIREAHLRAFLAGETIITPLELRAVVGAAIKVREALAADLQCKREQEETTFRQELERLRASLGTTEDALADLASRIGVKNDQVRTLAARIAELEIRLATKLRAQGGSTDVYIEVQAVLLNSGGEPGGEVQEAMRAVVEFAKNEFGERADDGLRKCLEHLLVKEST